MFVYQSFERAVGRQVINCNTVLITSAYLEAGRAVHLQATMLTNTPVIGYCTNEYKLDNAQHFVPTALICVMLNHELMLRRRTPRSMTVLRGYVSLRKFEVSQSSSQTQSNHLTLIKKLAYVVKFITLCLDFNTHRRISIENIVYSYSYIVYCFHINLLYIHLVAKSFICRTENSFKYL